MPKPKQFLKQSKKSKHAPQVPTNADEYLAAGVEFEEAGEKWRGGDAAKSTRFFVRAIDCYDEALEKFPRSFDLAYNKARVQFELTQHPKLKDQLPGSLLDLLNTALESSRYALALKEDNADVLFNTAQVLTSLAQAIDNTNDPLPLLEEAIELFQRCLTLQEYYHTEYLDRLDNSDPTKNPAENTPVHADTPPSREASLEAERWATIVEPVTVDTLLDTILAQLETLTTLASMIPADSTKGLVWIEEYFAKQLEPKIQSYMTSTSPAPETLLTLAQFTAALSDANFRARRIDTRTYATLITNAFKLDLTTNPEGLVAYAEVLITYSNSVRDLPEANLNGVQGSRWEFLTLALQCLLDASKIPGAEDVAKIHLVRGDCELLRYQLGREGYDVAVKSREVLLKNAEKFYRGAGAVAKGEFLMKVIYEAGVKEVLVLALRGDVTKLIEAIKRAEKEVRVVLEEVVAEGLVGIEELSGIYL